LQTYRELFPKLHKNFVKKLMTEDIEAVLNEQEEIIRAEKDKGKQSSR
jgi:hypothetical protein